RQVHHRGGPAGLREDAAHRRVAGGAGARRRQLSAGPAMSQALSAAPHATAPAAEAAGAEGLRTLRVLSANIQAGSSTRRYSDYFTRSWSHALPAGRKRSSLDAIARLAAGHDIVGLQEADPGSLRSGFTNQTHYLAQRAGFHYWTHQPNRSVGG